jgi:hypothetical protein
VITGHCLLAAPNALEVHYEEPVERLWRDLKDWLAQHQPATLDHLSRLLMTRLHHYSAAVVRSLTGFGYLLAAAQQVNG